VLLELSEMAMLIRRFYALAAGLIAATLLCGTAYAQEKVKIRIGTHISISAHLYMQKKPEILKNYGKTYEVEWVRFAGSGDAMPALVAGKLDACLATPFPMANALNQSRVPVTIVTNCCRSDSTAITTMRLSFAPTAESANSPT
jgi:ABC-type nitrate/sulfonate/bicarbonate transport system substrate-binding protein